MQEVEDELERRQITPVKVVDRDHRRCRLGGAREQREQPMRYGQILSGVGLGPLLSHALERPYPARSLLEQPGPLRSRKISEQRA